MSEGEKSLDSLEERLGYSFTNKDLLWRALTHSSWANEHNAGDAHNERLEFLGDAVLELVISSKLFDLYPDAREGRLTRMRSDLVNEIALAGVAKNLHLDSLLRLARGEENQGGRQRNAVLSDALEAVLGGVYLDGGFQNAVHVVDRLFESLLLNNPGMTKHKDFKSRLQEATQKRHQGLPVYVLENVSGPEHARTFFVRVELPDGKFFKASGLGLKRSEQEAARTALLALGEPEEDGCL